MERAAISDYWSLATPEQQQEYAQLFPQFVTGYFASRDSQIRGGDFEVTGSWIDNDHIVHVDSQLILTGNQAPRPIDWKLVPDGGSFKIIEMKGRLEGVAFMHLLFAGVIKGGGNGFESVIGYLKPYNVAK